MVEGIGLELAPGETLAVLGTNGSGKSTLVKTLVGLLPPVAGAATVLGGAPGASPRRVAYLGQVAPSGFVLPLRAADVVAMGRFPARGLLGRMRAEDRRIVAESLGRMGAAHLANAPLEDLSGGQRQRVHIAQALAWQADLIVLDEPTAGLDVAGRDLLGHALDRERARGAAVVMCTHDIRDALEATGRCCSRGASWPTAPRRGAHAGGGARDVRAGGGGAPRRAGTGMDPMHRHDGHDHGAADRGV